jgi:hypothetical protein
MQAKKATTRKVSKERIVKTIAEAAQILGVSERTINQWKRKGMPYEDNGWINLDDVEAWHEAVVQPNDNRRIGEKNADIKEVELQIAQEKLRTLQERNEALAHARKVRERNILARAEYEQFLIDVVTITRDGIQALPDQLAKQGSTPDQQGKIYGETTRIVRAALLQMEELLQRKEAAFSDVDDSES